MAELQALQNCEKSILEAFVKACEELGLNYYLLGGTLLGAVRHEGFIPWDDDIDVGKLREDYEKFLNEGQKYLPEYYFIQTHHTDPEWPANFAKIRDSRTTFIESSIKDQKVNHGVYIDVFPLDRFTSDPVLQKRFRIKNWFFVRRISCVFNKRVCPELGSWYFRLFKQLASGLGCLRYPKLQSALEAREKLFRSAYSGEMVANHCGAWGVKEIVPAEWYGDGKLLKFEGLTVRVPCEYHKWLSQVYGNYMQLPPVEKRVVHHYTEVIDLNKPYTEYCNKI